jgi:hypothetical protein
LGKKESNNRGDKSKFLLARDFDGYTAWQRAAKWGNVDLFYKILGRAKENLTTEIKNILLATDRGGNNVWHRAGFGTN